MGFLFVAASLCLGSLFIGLGSLSPALAENKPSKNPHKVILGMSSIFCQLCFEMGWILYRCVVVLVV